MKALFTLLSTSFFLFGCSDGFNSVSYVDPVSSFDKAENDLDCGAFSGPACKLFGEINSARLSFGGVNALNINSRCVAMAQSHANDMAKNGFFSQVSPTEGGITNRAARFGLDGGKIGENIAQAANGKSAANQWMQSSSHLSVLLEPEFKSTGVGYSINSVGQGLFVQCYTSLPGDL